MAPKIVLSDRVHITEEPLPIETRSTELLYFNEMSKPDVPLIQTERFIIQFDYLTGLDDNLSEQTMLLSEASFSRFWDSPEEDEAWKDL